MEKSRAIEVLKPLVNSFVDYANITMKEEDDDIAEALEMAIEALKAQLSQEGTTFDQPVATDTNVGDTISRQAALDAIDTWDKFGCDESGRLVRLDGESESLFVPYIHYEDVVNAIKNLPTIQPEPSIPLSWIEKYIEWLKSFDNEFANLAAAHISVMAKKWRDEKK